MKPLSVEMAYLLGIQNEIKTVWHQLGKQILGPLWNFQLNYQHPFWYSESLVRVFHYSTIWGCFNSLCTSVRIAYSNMNGSGRNFQAFVIEIEY